jgi:hypothetical protein
MLKFDRLLNDKSTPTITTVKYDLIFRRITMKNNLKYDNFGNIDADFYVEQAYELRRAYYAVVIKKAIVSVKAFFATHTISHPLKSA